MKQKYDVQIELASIQTRTTQFKQHKKITNIRSSMHFNLSLDSAIIMHVSQIVCVFNLY